MTPNRALERTADSRSLAAAAQRGAFGGLQGGYVSGPDRLRVGNQSAEEENHALALAFEAAWNSHDMHAFGRMLTADADWVAVGGSHWKGREEIEREHAARHATHFKDSVWSTRRVHVAVLKPDVALIHIDWAIRDDRDPDGTPRQPREGMLTWLTIKESGLWRIRAGHNTNKR